jgi:adenylate kinase
LGKLSELNLILLGPPGAGKGTQAQRLVGDFNLPYISTGDILRDAVKQGSELGKAAQDYLSKGELVRDEIMIGLISERIARDDCANGFILDGFPRTTAQAVALEDALEEMGRRITAVLLLELGDEQIVKRLSGRRVSAKTGRIYHIEFDPSKHEGRCDIDGSRLIQREDDKPETIRHRLAIYHEQTEPLIERYEQSGVLRRFDGSLPPHEVHDRIRATLAALCLEEKL